MTDHEDIIIDELTYNFIVWTCEKCGCEMTVDVEGLPMIKDGNARNVIEPNYCPNCGARTED